MPSGQFGPQFTTQHGSIGTSHHHIESFIQLTPDIHFPSLNNLNLIEEKNSTLLIFLNYFIYYAEIVKLKPYNSGVSNSKNSLFQLIFIH